MRKWLGRLANWLMESAGPSGAFTAAERAVKKGKIADAERGYAQAARQLATSLGPNHPQTVTAMARQAWTLTVLGRYTDAADTFESALRAKRASGDSEDPQPADLERYRADALARAEPLNQSVAGPDGGDESARL